MNCKCVYLVTTTKNDYGIAQYDGYTPANMLTKSYSLGLQHTSLILDIHVMVN